MVKKPNLPHISRFLTAGPIVWLGKTILFLVITSFFLITLLSSLFPENIQFALMKERILTHPFSPAAHLALGKFFLDYGATTLAEGEFKLSQNLQPKKDVLGEASTLLNEAQRGPKILEEKLAQWQEVIKERPDYRDAYIQLASLSYQLKRVEEARSFIDKALSLDPNFEPAKKLKELLNKN